MKTTPFDICGIAAVGLFAAVVFADLPHLSWRVQEVELRPSDAEMRDGFRSGLSWYGLYAENDKIGFARLVQHRQAEGFAIRQWAVLNLEVLGVAQQLDIEFEALMGPKFELSHFSLAAHGGVFELQVNGTVVDEQLEIVLQAGELEHTTAYELDKPPTIDFGANMMAVNGRLEAGFRYEIEIFDPLAVAPRSMTVEYVGRKDLVVVDGTVAAHHLRRHFVNTVTDVWVNDVGEVLREELPFGVTAVRETEADATWGLSRDGHDGRYLQLAPDVLGTVSLGISQRGPAP